MMRLVPKYQDPTKAPSTAVSRCRKTFVHVNVLEVVGDIAKAEIQCRRKEVFSIPLNKFPEDAQPAPSFFPQPYEGFVDLDALQHNKLEIEGLRPRR